MISYMYNNNNTDSITWIQYEYTSRHILCIWEDGPNRISLPHCLLKSHVTALVTGHAMLVPEPNVSAAVTATRSSRRTSSSSTIIARPTRRCRPSTITRTRPTSTRGAVISNWSSARCRPRRSTSSHACTPGRTSRPCSTAAVVDASITSISSMSVFLSLS